VSATKIEAYLPHPVEWIAQSTERQLSISQQAAHTLLNLYPTLKSVPKAIVTPLLLELEMIVRGD